MLNAPLCSPCSHYLYLCAVWCWAGNVIRALRVNKNGKEIIQNNELKVTAKRETAELGDKYGWVEHNEERIHALKIRDK